MLRAGGRIAAAFFFLWAVLCPAVFAAGTGTGFFISEDGYLATDWHVFAADTADIRLRDHTGASIDAAER